MLKKRRIIRLENESPYLENPTVRSRHVTGSLSQDMVIPDRKINRYRPDVDVGSTSSD